MDRACEGAEGMDQYDYLIVNDDLDTCVEEVHQIIRGEHHRSIPEIQDLWKRSKKI